MTALATKPNGRSQEVAEALLALASPAEAPEAKALTLSPEAVAFLSGTDIPGAAELQGPSDPYRRSLWVYRCISQIATSACGVPLRLSRGEAAGTRSAFNCKAVRWGPLKKRSISGIEKDAELKARPGEIVATGPLRQLLDSPNSGQTWAEFIEQTVGIFLSCGRVHWLFDEMEGRRPVSMRIVPGTITRPVFEKARFSQVLAGWSVRWEGREYPMVLEECLTWQLTHPLQPGRLFNPAEPAWLAVVSDYNASLYNASAFGNSAEPGGALTTDQPGSPEREEQIRAGWSRRHQGAARAKSVAVLFGGLKWQSIASTMADMQWGEGKRLTRTEACAAYGLSEVVAGFYTDANYGFAETGQEQFWWATEAPLLNRFAEGINIHLCPRFPGGQVAWFDVEDSPVVERMRTRRLEAVTRLFAMGVPLADANELYDLGLPERTWHQVGFLPAGLLPAGDVAEGNVFPRVPEGASGPGRDSLDQEAGRDTRDTGDKERKQIAFAPSHASPESLPVVERAALDRIWRAWAASWAGLSKALRPVLRARWFAQERKITAALKREGKTQSANLKAESEILGRILLEVFHDPEDRRRFSAHLKIFIAQGNELGLRQAFSEAGLTGEALDQAVRRLLSNPALTAAVAADATRVSSLVDGATERFLRHSLAEGMDAGESMLQLADRVQETMQNRRAAAITVARNAVGGALSRARWQGQVAAGMTHKVWLHSRGPGERRPAHVMAEAVYAANPCPIREPFVVNGARLMYPRDHSANAPEETVNCQCLCLSRHIRAGQGASAWAEPEFVRYERLPAGEKNGTETA